MADSKRRSRLQERLMKALVYKGPYEVAVEDVEDPTIQAPTDALVRITSTAICGSDLHMYEARTAAEPGIVFGHENQGISAVVSVSTASGATAASA
jgi:glutathione-independent formaldehyde dehydrogenase